MIPLGVNSFDFLLELWYNSTRRSKHRPKLAWRASVCQNSSTQTKQNQDKAFTETSFPISMRPSGALQALSLDQNPASGLLTSIQLRPSTSQRIQKALSMQNQTSNGPSLRSAAIQKL